MASVREILGAFLSCVAMGYVCYGEALHAWFVSDDHVLLYGLHDARGGLEALGVREGAPFFRPLLALSFWFDWFVLDADPVLMHGLNVVLHALAGTSLWALARAWTGSTAAAGVTLLAFMTFPLHPEAVTWISARGYPLGGCFVLLALLLAGSGRGPGRLVACAACGFAALCSVEATLPLVCWPFLLAWGTGRARDGGRASAVLALVTVAWFALRVAAIGGLGGYRDASGASRHTTLVPGDAAAFAGDAFVHLFAPGPLDAAAGGLRALAIATGIAVVLVHAVAGPGSGVLRRAAALALCVLAALAVTAGWATLGADLSGTRYLYFASMFWCIALGWSAARARAVGGLRARIATVAVAVVVACQIVQVREVNLRWRAAGEIARAAIDGVVARVAGSEVRHVFLHGIPGYRQGAHVLPWGIEPALVRRLGPHVRVDLLADREQYEIARANWAQAPEERQRTVAVGSFDGWRGWTWD